MSKKPKFPKNDKTSVSGPYLPGCQKHPKHPPVYKGYRGKNDVGIPPIPKPSARRRRTEKKAREIIDRIYRPGERRRREAYESIRLAKQPVTKAKLIAEHSKKEKVAIVGDEFDPVDWHDFKEFKKRLLRRDLVIWPPQTDLLSQLELRIISEGISWPEFKAATAIIWNMIPSVSPKYRKLEYHFLKTGEWW